MRLPTPRLRIRIKLLILLLAIALGPLVAVTGLTLDIARQLGLELAGRTGAVLETRAREHLLASVRDSAALLRKETKLLETAARLQAQAVGQALTGPGPLAARVALADDNGVAVRLGVGDDPETAARLRGLADTLARLRQEYAPLALWQRIRLEDGSEAVSPAQAIALTPPGERPLWYERAVRGGDLVLVPPHPGQVTSLPLITVAAPIRIDGEVIGAAAIEAPVGALLGLISGEPAKPAHVMVVDPSGDAIAGPSMRIAAERRDRAIEARSELVRAAEAPGLDEVLTAMAEGRAGVRRVRYQGEDTLWAWASVDDFDTHLAFVVPYGEVVQDAVDAQSYVFDTLSRQRALLWAGLVVFVPIVIGLALFSSRAVTQPIASLSAAARRLADGDFRARAEIRSGDELEELGALFNTVVPQLEASLRLRESLGLAQELQQNLLPRRPPRVAHLDIGGLSRYCDETGGDYYDFLPLPKLGPGHVAVMIGDVAGHGIPAALLMTTARAMLRSRPLRPGRLARVLDEVNGQLCADSHAGRFMTLFLAVLDGGRRTIHWVGAGHDPGLIYDPNSETVQEIGGLDIPLGVDETWRYHELYHAGWSVGTVLLIGTDGITETRNAAGEMFGQAALLDHVRANAHRPAAEIAQAIIDALGTFRGNGPQRDDATLVVVKAV